MPLLDHYKATVTVSVTLESDTIGGVVSRYEVTRTNTGHSAKGGTTPPASRMSDVIEGALVDAVAAEKALRAGMGNAEVRRLK